MKQKFNSPYDFLRYYQKGSYKKLVFNDQYFEELLGLYPKNEQEKMKKNKSEFMKHYAKQETIDLPILSQEPFSYYILHNINNDIQETLKKNNINIDKKIILGTIPISKVNAGQKSFGKKQNLIVAYEGMFKFYYFMAAVVASFYTKYSSDYEEIEKYDVSFKAFQQSYNFNKYGHDKFIDLMSGFKKNNFVATLGWFEKDFHKNVAQKLWYTAELFSIAHEYGHILLNDRYGNENELSEFKSDYIALQITMSSNLDKNWGVTGSYIGIDFMFSCMELLEHINCFIVEDSHPTISYRKAVLRKLLQKSCPECFSSICDASDINYTLLLNLWNNHKEEIEEFN